MQLQLARLQIQTRDIDLHRGWSTRPTGGQSLCRPRHRSHRRIGRTARLFGRHDAATHQIFEIQMAVFVTDHSGLEAVDGDVVHHQVAGQQRPDGNSQTHAFDRGKGLRTVDFGQRNTLDRQADPRKQGKLDVAINRQGPVVTFLNQFFQLVLVRVGVEREQKDGQADDGHENQYHQAYHYALEPRFHFRPAGTSTGNNRDNRPRSGTVWGDSNRFEPAAWRYGNKPAAGICANLLINTALNMHILTDFPPEQLPELLRTMPKAELHVHIEGTLEPELIFALAHRNGVSLPYEDIEALRAAYAFTDLQSFLDIYYAGASVLLHEQDFFDLAMAYFHRAAADRIVHAELFFDPQTHTARGVPIETVIRGLTRACDTARDELGINSALILCFLRHLSEADAFETLERALPYRDYFVGIGLDSSERDNPPEKFARVFARCRELGLRIVAHAGEEGPADYIRDALDLLGAERIDHGVRCVDDPELVERLARARTPLTVCPLSNVKLRVFDTMGAHNVMTLMDAGLCVTVNSDDPAYFGGYLNQNFLEMFEALPQLGAHHAVQLAKNSFDASFVSDEQKARWHDDLLQTVVRLSQQQSVP